MRGVVGVEVVEQPRGARHHALRARVVGVERAQRVEVDALADLARQVVGVRAQVLLQVLAVLDAGRGRAEARDAQLDLADADLL